MEYLGFIYKTTCLINNKIYIGRRVIKGDNSDDLYLGSGVLFARAIKKYGKSNFKREILRYCNNEHELQIWEYYYIKRYNSQNMEIGYNIADGDVNSKLGNPMNSPVILAKVRGRKRTLEQRKRMSEANKGRIISEEQKRKVSEKLKGIKHTEKHNQKVSEALKCHIGSFLGRKHTEETKRLISRKNSGKRISEEQKERLRIAHLGKKHTKEHREHISRSNLGKHNHDQKWVDDMRRNNIGAKMITNGLRCTYLYPGQELPEGWKFGILKRRVV